MQDKQHLDLLLSIAQDFYLNKLSVSDLSVKYDVSRYYISKYLEEIIDNHLVSIHINTPFDRNTAMERAFKREFAVENVYIMKEKIDSITNQEVLLTFTAKIIQDLIAQARVVGITWGKSIYQVLDSFQQSDQRNLVFTSFVGELGLRKRYAEPVTLLQRAVSKYNSAMYLTIPAPLYVANDHLRQTLAEEPAVKSVLDVARKIDVTFSSVGTLSSIENMTNWGKNFRTYFPGLHSKKVAGVVYGRPYDEHGQFLTADKDTVFGLSLPEIKRIPHRVGILEASIPIRTAKGALYSDAFTDIITSESTANKILCSL